jgi:hypothetical protein
MPWVIAVGRSFDPINLKVIDYAAVIQRRSFRLGCRLHAAGYQDVAVDTGAEEVANITVTVKSDADAVVNSSDTDGSYVDTSCQSDLAIDLDDIINLYSEVAANLHGSCCRLDQWRCVLDPGVADDAAVVDSDANVVTDAADDLIVNATVIINTAKSAKN